MIARKSIITISLLLGLATGVIFMPTVASGGPEAVPGGPSGEQPFSVNARGLSYGSAAKAKSPAEEPDLILVVADDGKEGYVLNRHLNRPMPASPAEAANRSSTERRIKVFEADGVTQIGWFTVGRNATTGDEH